MKKTKAVFCVLLLSSLQAGAEATSSAESACVNNPPSAVRTVAGKVLDKIKNSIETKKQEHQMQKENAAKVSMLKTKERGVLNEGMLPRGSALITSSGELKDSGITAIIHAATGSMTKSGAFYEPTRESIANSIENSMKLAKTHQHKKIAIPFIASGIFASRVGISREELAELIVRTVNENNKDLQAVLVLYGDADMKLFQETVSKMGLKTNSQLEIVNGSITDFNVHKASAIVNAANMEVAFGGGISGVIGNATGASQAIDQEAATIIKSLKK